MIGKFTKRYSKPGSSNKEYIRQAKGGWSLCCQGKPTDGACDVLSNCVGYACGRFNEIYNEIMGTTGMKYYGLNNNAEDFVERAKEMYPELQFSDKPQPGAIICWRKGKAGVGSDGAGHVAVVEEVVNDNEIITSESAYSGTAFYVSNRKNDNGRWAIGSAYSFRTFILNPAVKLIEPVERDKYSNQVEVKTSVLRLRKTPSCADMSNYLGSFCPVGYFNVLETAKADNYDWFKIDEDIWIAKVSDVTYLPADYSKEEELTKRIKELETEIQFLQKKISDIIDIAKKEK